MASVMGKETLRLSSAVSSVSQHVLLRFNSTMTHTHKRSSPQRCCQSHRRTHPRWPVLSFVPRLPAMGPTTGGYAGESGSQPSASPRLRTTGRCRTSLTTGIASHLLTLPSPASIVSEAQQRRQQEQTGDSGDTETEDTLSHLHISPAPADSALLTSDLSAAEPQPSSPPATSSASPSSSPSSSSHSPSASPCSSPPPPPAKRAKRLTKAQQDAELLALIDPHLPRPTSAVSAFC